VKYPVVGGEMRVIQLDVMNLKSRLTQVAWYIKNYCPVISIEHAG
jgi:hypothetical protein